MVPEHPPGLGEPVGLERAGDPEVGHLGAALGVDQDVLRLDVAVDQPLGVRRGRARGRPRSRRRPPRRSAGAQPVDPLLQRLALDVLEDDVGVAAVLAGVDHRDHVRVGELGDRPSLAAEALDLVRLVGHLAVHHLHRDPALKRLVARQVHRRHAAAAELRLEAVAPRQHGPDQAGREPRFRLLAHSSRQYAPRLSRCRRRNRLRNGLLHGPDPLARLASLHGADQLDQLG